MTQGNARYEYEIEAEGPGTSGWLPATDLQPVQVEALRQAGRRFRHRAVGPWQDGTPPEWPFEGGSR